MAQSRVDRSISRNTAPQASPTVVSLQETHSCATVLCELNHDQSVPQYDQKIHVPAVALAVARLTISHAKLLLPVPMKGLRACPAIALDLQNPNNLECAAPLQGMKSIATKNVAFLVQFRTPEDAENAELFMERLFNGLGGLCALCGSRLRHVTWWRNTLFCCYSLPRAPVSAGPR